MSRLLWPVASVAAALLVLPVCAAEPTLQLPVASPQIQDLQTVTSPVRVSLADSRRFSFLNSPWMKRDKMEAGAVTRTAESLTVAGITAQSRHELPETTWAARTLRTLRENAHGEVGVMYGRFIDGKVSGDVMESYIYGTTGTDKFQISVGAFFQETDLKYKGRRR